MRGRQRVIFVVLYTNMSDESMLKIYFYRVKNWVIANENSLVLAIGILLIAIIGFGLGALWQGSKAEKAPIVVDKSKSAFNKQNQEEGIVNQEQKTNIAANILYVASKNGTSYHLPNCPGAKQIKPENKIEFNSKEEAEKAGYKPAANCPGLLQ